MKFRKKPVIIEAHQWFQNGDHPLDESKPVGAGDPGFYTEGKLVRRYRDPNKKGDWLCVHCGYPYHDHGWIDTLEGGHIVCPADWIITGVQGEHYPCKPHIFKETYEPVFTKEE